MLDCVQLTGRFVILACGHEASEALMDCGTEGHRDGLGSPPLSEAAALYHPRYIQLIA